MAVTAKFAMPRMHPCEKVLIKVLTRINSINASLFYDCQYVGIGSTMLEMHGAAIWEWPLQHPCCILAPALYLTTICVLSFGAFWYCWDREFVITLAVFHCMQVYLLIELFTAFDWISH